LRPAHDALTVLDQGDFSIKGEAMDDSNEDALNYKMWIRQIKDFDAGWPGLVVILVTLVFTGLGGWFGSDLFPAGRYPQLMLAIPGLIAGAIGFFLSSSLLWNMRQSKEKVGSS
jgi:hypothetical protein